MGQQRVRWSSHSNSIIAGASAGFVSSVVTCPLDVVKTKLQAQILAKGTEGYLGIAGTVKNILLNDGVKGLYRGLGPTMLGYLPTWAIYFTVYDGIKRKFGGDAQGPSANSWSLHLFASMSAGATGTILTSPLWVIKTRFMTQPPTERRYRNTWDAFRTIYRVEGYRAFYRGLLPSLLGVTHVAIQFPLYEHLKLWFSERLDVPTTALPQHALLCCTAISKFVATMITYPHEVVRTRLQVLQSPYYTVFPPKPPQPVTQTHDLHATPYRYLHSQSNNQPIPPPTETRAVGTFGMASRILRDNGWRGFYKGLSINLVRTIPNSAVTILTYELLMRHLSSLTGQ
ncbi:hypothetical protein FRC03_012626 [Tulasnella sp. 419]|nr:hypothetical protein FRC03_012626 [Tulasnella sp. 419]